MKIVMFSMTPLFPNRSMGGAQKQLKKVALHLAEEGHEVVILCTRRSDAMQAFQWHENLRVEPIYRFKQPFPEPYATPVYHIAAAIQDTGEYLKDADVFYNHDGGLIFPYIYQDIPAVVSLRSIIFSETLQSGYLFQGDALIVPSEHTAQGWLHTVGRFFPDLKQRLHVIHNGLDFEVYRPTEPVRLRERIALDAEMQYILYPHRPEEPKGILQTIEVVDLLVHQYRLTQIRVLVPKWIDTGLSADVRAFYDDLEADIARRGLAGYFVFHDWISDDLMPEYLSIGALTFVLGSYVETFGNVPYESLACGTPVVASRVGPYRDMLPEFAVSLVDYGDIAGAAAASAAILQRRERVSAETIAWLQEHFQQDDMVRAYADLILQAAKRGTMPYRFVPITDSTTFQLAPWCYRSGRGIYHDFRADYCQDAALLNLLGKDDIVLAGSNRDDVLAWYREGYLVPQQGQVSE
jgi:glycosyltransferase involved in cell wall biosynthesis